MYQVTKLHYHRQSKQLDISFDDGMKVTLSAELLRTHSPSAEVQGHSPEQAQLVLNKQNVTLNAIEPVGHYAVRLCFDDGHNSGLFSWQYLRKLCTDHQVLWAQYQEKVQQHHKNKDSVPIKFVP